MADSDVTTESPARRLKLPRLSGKVSAAWLVACFLLTAILIPMALHLPQWIEFEIVLAAWWVIWLAVLTAVLYRGQRVTDDYRMPGPGNWPEWWGELVGTLPGLEIALIVFLVLTLFLGVIWLLFEIAIPLLLFLLYFLTRGMLARVVNDCHHCRGRLGRALAWGLVWATAYTAPLAGTVWFIHYVYQKSPG
jgi:hypothetical protein